METVDLRIALLSGNYNMVRDGANQALNRLVGYLLGQGAKVRVYSPTIDNPDFEATGDVTHVPSVAIPGRSEYRMPMGLFRRVKRDLADFNPNMMHVTSPDFSGHRALTWARQQGLPVLCSVHTRFDTYPRYYNMAFTEPLLAAIMRRFYRRCDALVAPSESMAQLLREQRMNFDIGIWSRGVDRELFNPGQRSLEWRRSLGIADSEVVIGFLGRLVMEKGLDVFSDTIDELKARGVTHRILVIGEGPARGWFEARIPDAVFVGLQQGVDLGRAVASMDVLFNPSVTETFGNVTLEAMACSIPVVAAAATGSDSLVDERVSGRLVRPGAIHQFAEAVKTYAEDPQLRRDHGSAGAERASQFSWDRINQAVAETYLRIIRQKQAARGESQRSVP
ncbi:MAG: glycosyltransferase family 1 protein [Novosphingobium sp.]|nr:glycosyltransferase family 1 protein [Novosphingobium sp.]